MSKWNPTTHPYRVYAHLRSASAKLHGWRGGVVGMFRTEAEARAAVPATLPAGTIDYTIDFAANAAEWARRGKWQAVATIKP
jgi:hypothetical protein